MTIDRFCGFPIVRQFLLAATVVRDGTAFR